MKKILTEEISKFVKYDENSPSGLVWIKFYHYKQNKEYAGSLKNNGYYSVNILGKSYWCHRVVAALNNLDIDGLEVDHIDGNPSNNRIENLRVVNHRTNMQNKKNTKCGIYIEKRVINGHENDRVVCSWWQSCGKLKRKYFSINKYGLEEAMQLATSLKAEKLKELNEAGENYSQFHFPN